MHPKPFLAGAALLLLGTLSSNLHADAGQITGTWQCQQRLHPDPQVIVQLDYEHQFSPNRQFNLGGSLQAEFAGNQLLYRFRGDGDWSIENGHLLIETRNSEFRPDNATAQQFHDLGILKADQFNNAQSSDRFEILQLTNRDLHLKHTRENFITRCKRG
ncbi:hypothetical protein SAMN05660443_0565 [Marinospirillum celere]|uniref:Lipocalin-like domain-containing protein n=1 Tax=Marinospirillum celere TaxID=1122252 RepID=A0A1I1EJQ8_9GAMM|nr:hypothetical protein [Marinospirillum celere]SFB85688.1 hypothetical protein SAMN05660443_0565 [Marinospirillum celere]